jgi:hypothetical protein
LQQLLCGIAYQTTSGLKIVSHILGALFNPGLVLIAVALYHTVMPFQHKCSTKQAKHETKNKQKATKIQKLKHLVISIEII